MEMLKWMQSKEAEKVSKDAKEKAWKDFKIRYPYAALANLQHKQILLTENMQLPIYISKLVLISCKVYDYQTEDIGLIK